MPSPASRKIALTPPKSGSICRAFLDQHAPKKTDGKTTGDIASKQASPAQLSFAEKIAQEHGVVIPDEAKASSAAMSAWIESNQKKGRDKRSSKSTQKPKKQTAPKKRPRNSTGENAFAAVPQIPARQNLDTETLLRIPYGNKEAALKLGARYRSGGWYAPSGVDLAAFGERGWL